MYSIIEKTKILLKGGKFAVLTIIKILI